MGVPSDRRAAKTGTTQHVSSTVRIASRGRHCGVIVQAEIAGEEDDQGVH